MKKKIVVLLITLSLALSACTLNIIQPAYVDAITGEQVYQTHKYQFGPYRLPELTVYTPYRDMPRR